MDNDKFAIYAGIIIGITFIFIAYLKRKRTPSFNNVAVVILSTAGAVVGLNLGLIVIIADNAFLCGLADQRLPIFLGALAVIWTSLETLISTIRFAMDISNKRDSSGRIIDSDSD